MKTFNHRGTENTEGLYALSLPNLEAIRDDLIKLMTKKFRPFMLKIPLGELEMGRLLSKKMSYLMGRTIVLSYLSALFPNKTPFNLCPLWFKNKDLVIISLSGLWLHPMEKYVS